MGVEALDPAMGVEALDPSRASVMAFIREPVRRANGGTYPTRYGSRGIRPLGHEIAGRDRRMPTAPAIYSRWVLLTALMPRALKQLAVLMAADLLAALLDYAAHLYLERKL